MPYLVEPRAAAVVLVALSISGCEAPGPECNPGLPGWEVVAPDGKHIARVHETFCGGTLPSDAWVVGIREGSESVEREEVVFVTFDFEPHLAWGENGRLIIELAGPRSVNVSKHAAKGIPIGYVVDETSMLAQLRKEQQNLTNAFRRYKDSEATAERLNREAEERYKRFMDWVRRNAEYARQ